MKKLIQILLILIITTKITYAYSEPDISATSAVVMDAQTGQILYQKNAHKKMYPASLTKIMTGILAAEYGKFNEDITFSYDAIFGIGRDTSHIALDVGEKLKLEYAMYALMLNSANDAANGIAELISGSVPEFSKLMTKKAKEIGAFNTKFQNPHGLHDPNHYTTAYDLAIITKYGLQNKKFKEVASTVKYTVPPTNKNETRYLLHGHKMLRDGTKYTYAPAYLGKTGYTHEAKNTLVTVGKKDGLEVIVVTLNNPANYLYKDTINLFEYTFDNFERVKLSNKDTFIDNIKVVDYVKNKRVELGNTSLVCKTDSYLTLPKNYNLDNIVIKKNLPTEILAPIVKQETTIGTVSYLYEDKEINKISLVPTIEYEALSPIKFFFIGVVEILKFIGFVVSSIFVLLFILRLMVISHMKKKKRRRKNQYTH